MYDLPEPEYYVVSVPKEEDPSTKLTYLKSLFQIHLNLVQTNIILLYVSSILGKMTCHPGIYSDGGWIIPIAFLLSNG